jgi:hypothetical protein
MVVGLAVTKKKGHAVVLRIRGLDVDKWRCSLLANEAQGQGRPHEQCEGDDTPTPTVDDGSLDTSAAPPPRRGLPPRSFAA